MEKEKGRLDIEMTKRGLVKSRAVALRLISEKQVLVEGVPTVKASKQVTKDSKIELLSLPKFVSRGGEKLAAALTSFKIDPKGLIILDVGSSTGGFSDCLLQAGAQKVYAVDVGIDQLALKLKSDKRLISMEKTDIRQLESLPEKADLAVIDVSFISLDLVLPHIKHFLKPGGKVIALVKPQFETPPEAKNKKGVVTDKNKRLEAVKKVGQTAVAHGFAVCHETVSPIAGGDGNIEHFLLLLIDF